MKSVISLGKRFFVDEKASEMTEVAMVLALVVLASVGIMTTLGTTISGVYNSVVKNL